MAPEMPNRGKVSLYINISIIFNCMEISLYIHTHQIQGMFAVALKKLVAAC